MPGAALQLRDFLIESTGRGTHHCRAWAASSSKVVLADLVEELATADAETLGSPGAVAAAGDEGAADGAALDFGEEGAEGERLGQVELGRDGGGSPSRLVDVEVFGKDRA